MLTPHTNSLSCGLFASGNAVAYCFEVNVGIKGSRRDGKKRHGLQVYLDMTCTLHANQWTAESELHRRINTIPVSSLVSFLTLPELSIYNVYPSRLIKQVKQDHANCNNMQNT